MKLWFGFCRCTTQESEPAQRYFDPSVSVRQNYEGSSLGQQVCGVIYELVSNLKSLLLKEQIKTVVVHLFPRQMFLPVSGGQPASGRDHSTDLTLQHYAHGAFPQKDRHRRRRTVRFHRPTRFVAPGSHRHSPSLTLSHRRGACGVGLAFGHRKHT